MSQEATVAKRKSEYVQTDVDAIVNSDGFENGEFQLITALEDKLRAAAVRHNRILPIGLFVVIFVIFLEAILYDQVYLRFLAPDPNSSRTVVLLQQIFGLSDELARTFASLVRAGFVEFATLVIAVALYYFLLRSPMSAIKQELERLKEKLRLNRIKTREGWRLYLQEEVRRLSHATSSAFLDNRNRAYQAKKWLEEAHELVVSDRESNLGQAQSLVSSINQLVLREREELQEQSNWRTLAMGIVVFYILSLTIITLLTDSAKSDQPIPVIGVPLSVIMWGAIGSLGALLYRFYTEQKRIRFDIEVRWLIARPVVGIVMGAVSYLAVRSGLLLLGATSDTSTRIEVYWIIAFLAGFSDKFYIGIINLLVERTFKQTGEMDEFHDKQKKELPDEEAAKY